MRKSNLFIDTIIDTNLKIEENLVFERLDPEFDFIKYGSYLGSINEKLKKDSVEYYFIANLTKDTLEFLRNNLRMVGQDYGKSAKNTYRPISLFLYVACGTGIDCAHLKLYPQQLLIIRSKTRISDVSSIDKPNCYIKLKLKYREINSKPFKRNILQTDFYLDQEESKYMYKNENRKAFKN